jgi:pimeloyl-ACP methyl ester carboxylesterase
MDNDGDIDIVAGGDRMKTILFWENTLYSPKNPKIIEIPALIPLDPILTYQEIPILTEDGLHLNGFVYQPEGGPTHETVIFLGHEAGASHMAWESFAQTLTEQGYLVLTIDFRGHSATGGSGPDYKTNGVDVRAALDYLSENGYDKVVCIGSSMGGTGCLAAAKTHPLAALGMISSPKVIVYSADKITKSDLASFDFPKIITVAENDKALNNDPDFVNDILAMYEQMIEPKELILAEGFLHGTELLFGEGGEEIRQALLEMIASVSN